MISEAQTSVGNSAKGSTSGRDWVLGLGGLLLAIGLAAVVSWASFALVLLPSVPRAGRIAGITIALGIGVFQVIYLLPIHTLAKRREAKWFSGGIRVGATMVLLANVALWVLSFLWPSPRE